MNYLIVAVLQDLVAMDILDIKVSVESKPLFVLALI